MYKRQPSKDLEELLKCVGPDGGEQLPPHRFLDWPTSGNEQALHAGLHALLVLALEAGAELCSALARSDLATVCRQHVHRLRRHVPDPGNSKQAAALLALARLKDPVAINREVLAVDGGQRLSTFYGYYVLQARAAAGDYQGCLDCLREYWGGMLDLGATTFWEHFDLEWATNAAPIDDLGWLPPEVDLP